MTTTTDDQPNDTLTPEQRAMWGPAENNLPDAIVHELMFIATVPGSNPVIHQYKHQVTRRYINLDHYGQTYRCQVVAAEKTEANRDGYAMEVSRIGFLEALGELGIRDGRIL